jgi:hypothetical protein
MAIRILYQDDLGQVRPQICYSGLISSLRAAHYQGHIQSLHVDSDASSFTEMALGIIRCVFI